MSENTIVIGTEEEVTEQDRLEELLHEHEEEEEEEEEEGEINSGDGDGDSDGDKDVSPRKKYAVVDTMEISIAAVGSSDTEDTSHFESCCEGERPDNNPTMSGPGVRIASVDRPTDSDEKPSFESNPFADSDHEDATDPPPPASYSPSLPVSVSKSTAVSSAPSHQSLGSNPFDDEGGEDKTAFSASKQSNPFADEDEHLSAANASAATARGGAVNRNETDKSKVMNPFDEEENGDKSSTKITNRAQGHVEKGGIVLPSTAIRKDAPASTPASGGAVSEASATSRVPVASASQQDAGLAATARTESTGGGDVRSSSRVSSSDMPQKIQLTPEQKLKFLLLMGFNAKAAASALESSSNSLRAAVKVLGYEATLRNGQSLRGDGVFVWKPPVSVSVGSWLPSQPAEDGSTYITYIVTVTFRHAGRPDHTFQIEKRYSEFYNVYCALYDMINVLVPAGLTNAFPDDRWSNWWWGSSEQRNDQRRAGLDAWFREVVSSIPIMTTLESFIVIRDFLDIKHVLD